MTAFDIIIYYSVGFLMGIILSSFSFLIYHGKILLILILFFISSAILLPFSLVLFPIGSKMVEPGTYIILFIGKLLGTKLIVRGKENINYDAGGVILMNHQCILDIGVACTLWPLIKNLSTLMKKEILYLPFYGLINAVIGATFIDRSNRKAARKTLGKAVKSILKNQIKLICCPEGTRNEKRTLLPFKKGAFHVAIQAQCPIQPVVTSKYLHFNSAKCIYGRGTAIIKILPEISTKGLTINDLDDLIENVQNLMQDEFNKLTDEIIQMKLNDFNKEFV